jgi:hypothetical protein
MGLIVIWVDLSGSKLVQISAHFYCQSKAMPGFIPTAYEEFYLLGYNAGLYGLVSQKIELFGSSLAPMCDSDNCACSIWARSSIKVTLTTGRCEEKL